MFISISKRNHLICGIPLEAEAVSNYPVLRLVHTSADSALDSCISAVVC